MKQRMMLFAGMLLGSLTSAQGITSIPTPTAPPVAMPEPAGLAELGTGLSGLLAYCWWRVARRKRGDS